MSAESQKTHIPAVVPPQVVSDRSIIDSVAQWTQTQQKITGDPKNHILWIRFENSADISDHSLGDDWELEGGIAPPLILILGYLNGVQIWAIPANGEAVEVLSWRHGTVKCLRILPTPAQISGDLADESSDQFQFKRPLMAINDNSNGSNYCSVNFISLKDGDLVKSIKFKNPIVDILANRSSIVVSFTEKIAVFDAKTLEDRLTVTTCHPSPGINPNPIALGQRWIAYAEKKLLPSKRSSGGCDCDGITSYTATVLNAAKSLGKGLRELGEQVAAGFSNHNQQGYGPSGCPGQPNQTTGEIYQPGIITILDIKNPIRDISPTTGTPVTTSGNDPIIAHFIAHSDAIVAVSFDVSGMLLVTADRRGHDFHVFRIHPHPGGPSLASVHHLYVLHRGDTSAKVQDIAFSLDSRWIAISTLRGTTHVFPITPYGGAAGVRTHGSPHVVNRLSRFHRSAGLSVDGRSSSPVSYSENSNSNLSSAFANPRIPPFPHPTVVLPLAQLRQPSSLGNTPTSATLPRTNPNRQRLSSVSDDGMKPLRVCATFAAPRSWLLDPPGNARETSAHRLQKKSIDSLFIMAGHGALIQYDLEPRHASNIPKEKICDDTPIELDVEAKAQWYLQREENLSEIEPPLQIDNWLIKERSFNDIYDKYDNSDYNDDKDDRWLSNVEIITHASPHRRIWMGPQFMFKIYNTPSGLPLSSIDIESVEIGTLATRPARSTPMNMPLTTGGRSLVPVLIESSSCSSYEQSPRLTDTIHQDHHDADFSLGPGESQLREDLADAMKEAPMIPPPDEGYGYGTASNNTSITLLSNNSSNTTISSTSSNSNYNYAIASSSLSPPSTSLSSSATSSTASSSNVRSVIVSIAKVVNPLGTVSTAQTSVTCNSYDMEKVQKERLEISDRYIHENCDESLFRPVITVCGEVDNDLNEPQNDGNGGVISKNKTNNINNHSNINNNKKITNVSKLISNELIVPVIEEKLNNKLKNNSNNQNNNKIADINKKHEIILNESKLDDVDIMNLAKFDELSLINKKSKQHKTIVADSNIIKTSTSDPSTAKLTTAATTSTIAPNVADSVKLESASSSKSKKNQAISTSATSGKAVAKKDDTNTIKTDVNSVVETKKGDASKNDSDEEKELKKVKKVDDGALKKEVKEVVVKTKGKKNKYDKFSKEKDNNTTVKEKANEKTVQNTVKLPESKIVVDVPTKSIVPTADAVVEKHVDEDDVVIIENETSFSKLPQTVKEINNDVVVLPQEKTILLENLMTSSNEAIEIQESLMKNFKPIVHKTFAPKVDDGDLNVNNIIDDIINAYDDVDDDDEDDDVQSLLSKIKFKDPEEFFDITTSAKFDVEFLETEQSLSQDHCRDYDNFERLSYKDAIEDSASLINFESPIDENAVTNVEFHSAAEAEPITATITTSATDESSTAAAINDNSDMLFNQKLKDTYFSDTNLVFAMCSSLKDDLNDRKLSTSSTASSLATGSKLGTGVDPQEGQDSDYKSLELEIEESYTSMEQSTVITNIDSVTNLTLHDYTSSDDNDDSSNDVKHIDIDEDHLTPKTTAATKLIDDEELQPFIKVEKNKTRTEPSSSSSTLATISSSSSSTFSGSSSANNSAKDILPPALPPDTSNKNRKTASGSSSSATTTTTTTTQQNNYKKKSKQKRKNF